jgi:hypothetical protein
MKFKKLTIGRRGERRPTRSVSTHVNTQSNMDQVESTRMRNAPVPIGRRDLYS